MELVTIENIIRLYGEAHLNSLQQRLSQMAEPEGVTLFLAATDDESKIRQHEFDKYLYLAFKHNIINTDLLNRLKSNKWDVFFQARNELMAAYFIENLGLKVTFHPKGLGNSIGEFNFCSDFGDIFCEVKSPIRKPANRIWMGNDAKVIRRVIKDAASKQLDKNKMNLLIFAGDMRVSITNEKASGVIEALYGTHKIVFEVYESGMVSKPELEFEQTGLFQPGRNTRISAVATLEDRLTENGFSYSFKIFHNPFAAKPINVNIFTECRQYVLDEVSGTMVWLFNK